ncbi:DUF4870 domain-containing protein [Salibacteraceae bacterium]|nr:DUF4870 domain-containing protein [Salibacteraceae bacterium]MDC1304203.1 DUF4870 domain-containing protein [Salibacteraceae bacterium]
MIVNKDPISSESAYVTLPQPDQITEREKEDAMGAYLMMFAAVAVALPLPVVNLIAAIVYYYVNRSKSRFVHFHSLQSLISQLPTTLLNWGLLYWSIRVWFFNSLEADDYFFGYFLTTVIANLLYLVFSIIGAVQARKGRMYYFLFFGKLSYELVFSKSSTLKYKGEETIIHQNSPPN